LTAETKILKKKISKDDEKFHFKKEISKETVEAKATLNVENPENVEKDKETGPETNKDNITKEPILKILKTNTLETKKTVSKILKANNDGSKIDLNVPEGKQIEILR
jgi:hypothetical protein